LKVKKKGKKNWKANWLKVWFSFYSIQAINQLKGKDELISKMRNEKETLRTEIHKVEDLQNDQSNQLKEKISNLTFELKNQKEIFKEFKNKSEKRESSLLEEKSNFENEITELNNNLKSKIQEIKTLNDEMSIRETEWKTKKSEFESYKNRALQLLQVN
jgi:chromosome segregation ATPase